MLFMVNSLELVEAAGVEPASEIIVNKERLHAQSRSGGFAFARSEPTRCAHC